MKIQIVGLGSFGMFLAQHFLECGWEVWGIDFKRSKKVELKSLGGKWGDNICADVRLLAVFPSQIKSVPDMDCLVVNVSSVQQPGIGRLEDLGVRDDRLMSFHPLFGPVGVAKSGWTAKQIIVTRMPEVSSADDLLETFVARGVDVVTMSAQEHDQKMSSHALAFFLAELIEVGATGADPKYLTGSARHMFGLLEFTEKSPRLRELILSNSALKEKWPAIKKKIEELEKEFGWDS